MATVAVRHFDMHIGGEPVSGDNVYEVVSPATEETVATVAYGDVKAADRAVAAARESFESGVWSRMQPLDRAAIMLKISERLGEEMFDLAELESASNGCTMRQSVGFHVGFALAHWGHFAEQAGKYRFEEPLETAIYPTVSSHLIRREPIGVCAGIVAWNFPLLLAVWKLGPGLAAGNSFVMKPASQTPLTLLRFAEIAAECGLPPGVLNVVTGSGGEVGSHLAAHPDVDKVAFTGSTEVGRQIMRLASDTVKNVTLELGGKSPNIVLDDADLDTAVDASLFGSMLYCGQACESVTRLLLHEDIHDEFVERLVERAKTISMGAPDSYDSDMGPVISASQRDKILAYIKSGVEQGATLKFGGGVPKGPEYEKGFWVEPTIFTDVTNDMKIAQEEIFGPVLSVIKFKDDDEAVAIANDTIYGLASAVWSRDNLRALDIAGRLRAGSVWINEVHGVNCKAPFGGYKQSGVGRELGPHAIDTYTEQKHIQIDMSSGLEAKPYDVLLSAPPE